MTRRGIVLLFLFMAFQGSAFGQGFLDSVFGPSGFGITGGSQATTQFDSPRYYGANTDPMQQLSQQPQMGYPQGAQGSPPQGYAPQGYPPQGYAPQGYPPQGGGYQQSQQYDYNQSGVYSDWNNQPLATNPPPVQYSPPGPQAAPSGPPPAPAARLAPQRSQRTTAGTRPGVSRAPQGGVPSGTGQYPADQAGRFGDELPAGAVRITTTTPEGTTVQLYPPGGQPESDDQSARPQSRQARPRAAASRPARGPQAQEGVSQEQQGDSRPSSIAMPKPVAIPQGQDPRSGWGAAVNR